MSITYLQPHRADIATVLDNLQKAHSEGRLSGMVVTYWEDGAVRFSIVGNADSRRDILEAIGSVEYHKHYLTSILNDILCEAQHDQTKG